MNRSFIKSSQSLGKIVVIVASLIWLGSMYQVGAAPPTPPGPSPTPAIDVQTKLQPYQTSELKPSQADGRLLKESTLLSEAQESSVGALGQQTFSASADTTVFQGYPTLNFGNTTDMWAGYDDSLSPDGRIVRSLIRFNPANLPPNQIITKATLRVYLIVSYDFPNTNRTITTYRVTSNWSESSVTWNNAPGFADAYGSKSIVHGAWGWYEFDVTNLVSAWYNGTYPNYGIKLRGPEISGPDSSWRGFSTREGSNIPQLVIEYSTPVIINPPSNLTAQPISKTQINLAWQDNSSNETGFKIERSPNNTTGWAQIATVGANVTTYANTGLSCGTSYFYRVRAYNASDHSSYSNSTNATTFACSSNSSSIIYLPIITKPSPPPPDGHWTGTTSRGYPMSFDVSTGGKQWRTFKLKTDVSISGCNVATIELPVPGPGPITNSQFSGSNGKFSFSGQLTSLTTASGTYAFVNEQLFGCPQPFTQSGTWTASRSQQN